MPLCTVPKALAGLFSAIFIKARVAGVEILAVEMVGRDPEAFAETLVVDDLPFPQEFQRIADIRVVDEAEQVVVRCTGLLLGCHILVHVADDIALALDIGRGPRRAGRGLRPNPASHERRGEPLREETIRWGPAIASLCSGQPEEGVGTHDTVKMRTTRKPLSQVIDTLPRFPRPVKHFFVRDKIFENRKPKAGNLCYKG